MIAAAPHASPDAVAAAERSDDALAKLVLQQQEQMLQLSSQIMRLRRAEKSEQPAFTRPRKSSQSALGLVRRSKGDASARPTAARVLGARVRMRALPLQRRHRRMRCCIRRDVCVCVCAV